MKCYYLSLVYLKRNKYDIIIINKKVIIMIDLIFNIFYIKNTLINLEMNKYFSSSYIYFSMINYY